MVVCVRVRARACQGEVLKRPHLVNLLDERTFSRCTHPFVMPGTSSCVALNGQLAKHSCIHKFTHTTLGGNRPFTCKQHKHLQEGNCKFAMLADIEFGRMSECTYVMITGHATQVTDAWEESLAGKHIHVAPEVKYIFWYY